MNTIKQRKCLRCGKSHGCSSKIVSLSCRSCKIINVCELRTEEVHPDNQIGDYCPVCLDALEHYPSRLISSIRDSW